MNLKCIPDPGVIPTRCRWIIRAIFGGCIAFSYLAYCLGLSSDNSVCRAMVNNVFLAYLPVEMSFHVSWKRHAFAFWGTFIAWLLFYPNAPYVLTDYFHLAHIDPYVAQEGGKSIRIVRPDLRLWLTFTVLSSSAMISAIFGTWSLDHVTKHLQARIRRHGPAWLVLLVAALAALSSVGIYLGRFPRIHSVHLLTSPYHVLGKMATSCSLNMFEFVILLTLTQLVTWGCLRLVKKEARS
ncbi:MAG: DUF1361 domain-containing protein [Kiritimatiellae bacterium]|nr:DUF1361 domain-containing protein [Kiritimatiellia bacterium]